MQLDAGVDCVSHTTGSTPPDTATGLPGAAVAVAGTSAQRVTTTTGFSDDSGA